MTINDLSTNIEHLANTNFLSEWQWLIGSNTSPVMVTISGDAFLQDKKTKAVIFLDTVEGTAEEVATNGSDFEALLAEQEFVMNHFSVELVAPLLQAGSRPEQGKVFSFKKPPVLGGDYDDSNLETADIDVHFSILGQIWEQVSKLPEGTPINDIKIDSISK